MTRLSTFDKALLNLLQGDIPICSHPFAEMASRLGTDEGTVLARLRELKEAGFLRRIGTFFDSNRLGYQGTLVALKVAPSAVDTVAQAVNRYPGATHNYEREDQYNLWFTLLTPNAEYESNILAEIRSLNGVEDMLRLKANKKYKINVQFKLQ
ncbi:MAG: AsnC family transcriptional regulator [Selenomonadaceae bacterium]|nr:AsnC family transcriptional regulator [Selenomonadaceae bacterium]